MTISSDTDAGRWRDLPETRGHCGTYGGRFVAEMLMASLSELEAAYEVARTDSTFAAEMDRDLEDFVGRPSPIYRAEHLSAQIGGAQIWFKREDLNHTGAHKIHNTLRQALLAKRIGKTRVSAETGAG